MEEQQQLQPITILLQQIINSNHINIMQSLFSFLGKEEIESIALTALNLKKSQFFFKIAIAQHLLNTFINKVDRTNYYLFYDDPIFKKIEQQHLMYLINQHFQTLVNFHHSFTELQTTLDQQLSICDNKEQLSAIFSSLFFDTELSLPKMKRETIGMYCQSPLQDYVSLLRFPQDQLEQPWIQQCITQLKQKTEEGLQQIIEYHPYPSSPLEQPSNTAHEKIRILRFCPYKIREDNWKKYIIEGFTLHNILVIIFALCSQLVKVYSFIITQNQDPFQQFTEFTLRANIYRNLIINLDEKLGFLFELYSRFYQNVYYPPPDRPPFRFWLPAMSIWIQQMKIHHENNCKVFKYVATKMREDSLLQFLIQKTQKLPSFFTNLKDKIQLKIFSQSRKQEVYDSNGRRQQLQYFFQNNTELYEIISKDYLQYMIDISINEYSVHRCGHSQHQIKQNPLFKPLQQQMIKQSYLFYDFIKKILFQSCPQQLQLSFLKQVIRQDLNILNIKLVKQMTLKQIINMYNNIVRSQIQKISQYAVFGEQGISKYKITWDFQEKDTLLDYFCGKYQIEDCPQNLLFYYNIQAYDVDQIEDNNCEEDSLEYCEEYISQQEMQDQSQPYD